MNARASGARVSPPSSEPLVIGLTGPAGAGKSMLAKVLKRLGLAVLELDELGHAILEEPGVKKRLLAAFSTKVLAPSGAVSRPELARLVFGDARALGRLDRIVHPIMRRRSKQWITRMRQKGQPAAVVGALVYELGLAGMLDGVIVADAPFGKRLKRLACSRGWDAARLAACDAAQMPVERKVASGAVPLAADGAPATTTACFIEILSRHRWLPASVNPQKIKEKP